MSLNDPKADLGPRLGTISPNLTSAASQSLTLIVL